MNSGYLSVEAVKDLIAVKEGTIQYLTAENQDLKYQIDLLQRRIEHLEEKQQVVL
jgi:cell division protein FtsB